MGSTRVSRVTKSLESFMGGLGYRLNKEETKVGGNWWPPQTIFVNEATGKWKTVNLATILMLEASLVDEDWAPIEE